VFGLYLRDAPALVDSLGHAIEFHDQRALLAGAHSLKSNSGTLGARRLAELCRDLEVLGKRNDFAAASRRFPELLGEFSAVIGELSRAIDALGRHR
jgi:HPt (histidine-containing phosphotransfer) domain-containing protein